MRKILFVCHGNICRSAMAEYMLKAMVKKAGWQEEFVIASAAVSDEERGNDLYPPAIRKLKEKGIPFERHYARQITRSMADDFDEIYVMDHSNMRWIGRILRPDQMDKVYKLLEQRDVADPWYTDDFETCYQDLKEGCQKILEKRNG